MKKFMFLLAIVLTSIVAVQAQVDYTIINNSQVTIQYTVYDANGSNPVSVIVPPAGSLGNTVTGTFPDYILPVIPWRLNGAGQASGCATSGVILNSPSNGAQQVGGCLIPLFVTWNIVGAGPVYNLTVIVN